MSTTYERLVAAGAPAIVEPLFYRIREVGEGTSLRLEVRHRRPRFGSRLLVSRSIVRNGGEAAEEALLRIVVSTAREAVSALDLPGVYGGFVGDHSSAAQK